MKVKYSREVDILLVWLSDEPFDYAEEANGIIPYLTKEVDRLWWKSRVQRIPSWGPYQPGQGLGSGSVVDAQHT